MNAKTPHTNPSKYAPPAGAAKQDERALLTRRRFLYGAIGVGAVAAVGAGAVALNAQSNDDDISYLEVPEDALTTLSDLEVLETYEDKVRVVGEFDLPYGSLVWANDDAVAACLLPTTMGSPLTQVGLLTLGSGLLTTVLEQAVGAKESFEIYDVRATSEGVVWTEANVLEGTWRIYAARYSSNALGQPVLLEEGDSAYETPMLAAVGGRAFWQVLPKLPNTDELPSRLMSAQFGSSDTRTVFESARRMGTPPYATSDSVVITPRIDTSAIYFQLTNIDAKSCEVTDTLTLPSAMHPLEAGYGRNGFMFSFADIYNYGGGISNLGTYTPMSKPSDGSYDNKKWFGFARTPTAAPAWCKNLLIVKSSYSVCGVDLEAGQYFAIDVDNGADNYGEYLASSGTHDTFVTFTNIDYEPIGEDPVNTCRVKVWSTV